MGSRKLLVSAGTRSRVTRNQTAVSAVGSVVLLMANIAVVFLGGLEEFEAAIELVRPETQGIQQKP
jgi:hypothetical protein